MPKRRITLPLMQVVPGRFGAVVWTRRKAHPDRHLRTPHTAPFTPLTPPSLGRKLHRLRDGTRSSLQNPIEADLDVAVPSIKE